MIEFEGWPKTPRLSNGGITITEKIDGTNACIVIFPADRDFELGHNAADLGGFAWVRLGEQTYLVGAQSRKKLIYPGSKTDNAGFAGWVSENVHELVDLLGPGRHFGEWWGQGIQRRYGMDHKVFSLFNYHRFSKIAQERHDWRNRARDINMSMVPLLHAGKFSDVAIQDCLDTLRVLGSPAAAEWGVRFDRPEGIIIRHRDLGGNLKAFVEDDDVPKSLRADG
jgi:hypothetical protein